MRAIHAMVFPEDCERTELPSLKDDQSKKHLINPHSPVPQSVGSPTATGITWCLAVPRHGAPTAAECIGTMVAQGGCEDTGAGCTCQSLGREKELSVRGMQIERTKGGVFY